MLPEPIKKFVDVFAALPGIGPRQATRLAFYIFNQGKSAVAETTKAIMGLDALRACRVCFNSTDGNEICGLKRGETLNNIQKLRLKTIKNADEVILAINPNGYGDLNAELIAQELKNVAKKITRLGRGIPTGGEIEFADEETLGSALENRS
ncbi:MAG: Recombination protein RecR [Parcubacteria group bacterium GW2011_GWA2_47_8b]|nr:MAG: Recombination protein RecR [Parcubacteria group bacterium GW2011_GWA2_47_8b]